MNSFYNEEELKKVGFKKIGKNVLISKKASFYGVDNISIGDNVRIDDFAILSGKIELGNNIHISAGVMLFAGDVGIFLDNFTTISSRSVVYAITDDYSGEFMVGAMLPDAVRNVIKGPVILKKYAAVGTGCTILPNVTIEEGAAIGAMSLVNSDIKEYTINLGIPAKEIKKRSKKMTILEKELNWYERSN